MTQPVILAVDEGTSNCKAVLVTKDGSILASGAEKVGISHPQPGWVEQDAEHIWSSTISAIETCLSDIESIEIVALGISNQRESVLIWDRTTGKSLGPVITWQCRRTAESCEKLKREGHEDDVIARTGLPLDPLFPATKVAWLLKHHSAQAEPENICIGTVDSWLIWKFTGGALHATDSSNAARTQLFNLANMEWDTSLCTLFGVPLLMLPSVQDSSSEFGTTKDVQGLPDGIRIASAIGDSHAALFGHGAFQAGDGKITFGTGSSVMTTIEKFAPPPEGLTTTVAWSIDGKPTFAFEGNILVSASILPWTAELLGLKDVDELLELAMSVHESLGVRLVPALVGLGSPHWNSVARGVITGLSFKSGRPHIARAAAECIALQVYDIFAIIDLNSEAGIGRLFVDGGPSSNSFLMSLVANYLDHPVIVCERSELSALGAAYLAGITVGYWPDLDAIAGLDGGEKLVPPNMDAQARESALRDWKLAVNQSTLGT